MSGMHVYFYKPYVQNHTAHEHLQVSFHYRIHS